MTQHHHAPGHLHPSSPPPLSLLRLSLGGRLLVAGTVAAAVWLGVLWALT
jgi:hypothetical protein